MAYRGIKLSVRPKLKLTLPYEFRGGNASIFHCQDTESIVAGPAETGKTLAQLARLHLLAYEYPGAQFSIIRKKKTDLYGSVIRTFTRDILDNYGPGVIKYGGSYPQWYNYPGGSRIWLGGLDDPGKTLSSERDGIYVNQAEELSLADWEYLTRCVTGRGSVLPFQFLTGDCNPSSPTHWVRGRAKADKLTLFESTHKDNPTLWDGKEWTEQGHKTLKILSNLTGSRLLRLYHGIWSAPEGAVYSVFDEEKHVVKSFPIPPTWPRAVGIDPFGAQIAATWLAFDPSSGILNVYREYMEPFGLTTAGHAKNVLAETGDEPVFAWVCGGPSERAWRLEWQAAGIPVMEPPISDVWVGIDYVYQLLKEFRLVIHDSCVGLISEIGDYRRKMGRDGVATEKIKNKENYHCLAGDTMVLTAKGNIAIRNIQSNDVVLTRKGWRKVIASACTNRGATVYRVTFSDGRTLVGTGNHLVWTSRAGYIELRSLRYGDIIVTPHQNTEVLQWESAGKKSLCTSMAKDGSGIQNRTRGETNISRDQFLSTSMSGKCIMGGTFQKGMSFIISTVTQLITRLKISSRCPNQNMPDCINRLGTILEDCGNLQRLDVSMPRHGIVLRRAGSFIKSWASLLGKTPTALSKCVNTVVTNMRLGISPVLARVFVPISARRLGGANLALMMKSGYVNTAAGNLRLASILRHHTVPACALHNCVGSLKRSLSALNVAKGLKIIRVPIEYTAQKNVKTARSVRVVRVEELTNRIPVYNLEVEDAHEFFANGILVHNCLDSLRYVVAWLTRPRETTEVVGLPWMRIT